MGLDRDPEAVRELFSAFGPVSVRRMFGGAGIYADGLMFALIVDDAIFLKADADTRSAFIAEGQGPFVYDGKGKPVTMSYWRLPERLYDDPEELASWARIAVGVARRGKAAPASKRSVNSRR
jgi:DNA transformation protein and related proteins